ncbi:LacI family DNA-binding transcriptional regulator [Paenarthrobacter ureafaciens]|uniref:LacI family DNA-binding transcriptional regulator n=1 Tax=Paenarthrobacter ureafaciens TaxID=37931 RepID=UPI001C2C154E|nr:LacI family DNA-binding transcriptional regulator [Paenarthrobacter ureafaciens]
MAAAAPGSPEKNTRPGPKVATIYDVAKMAGVNPSTVSRAFSKPGRVSAKTAGLIEEAASTLSYTPNPMARALPTGQTETLGLIIADITNPTYFEIVRGAQTISSARGYTLVLAESAESANTELKTAQRMLASVDGLILAGSRMDDTVILDLSSKKPLVVINREVVGVPCVIPDVAKGVAEAIRHLAGNGHKKVAFVAGHPGSWMSAHRWDAVQSACEWSRLECVYVESSKSTTNGGRDVARAVLASGATAILAYNDLLAIGLLQELQAGGVSVPDDISIIGFDDLFGSDFTTPALTTVRSPLGRCGVAATTRLLDLLNSSQATSVTLQMETELLLRGSSGKAATHA